MTSYTTICIIFIIDVDSSREPLFVEIGLRRKQTCFIYKYKHALVGLNLLKVRPYYITRHIYICELYDKDSQSGRLKKP